MNLIVCEYQNSVRVCSAKNIPNLCFEIIAFGNGNLKTVFNDNFVKYQWSRFRLRIIDAFAHGNHWSHHVVVGPLRSDRVTRARIVIPDKQPHPSGQLSSKHFVSDQSPVPVTG
tara:strand:- start:304 stop:645 length:342 start_codon:yes stop_codon:yes gene_type:complete